MSLGGRGWLETLPPKPLEYPMKTEEQNVRYLELLGDLREVGQRMPRIRNPRIRAALQRVERDLLAELRDYVADEASVTPVKE